MADIKIYGELVNDTPGGYVTTADQLFDGDAGESGMTQAAINAELYGSLGDCVDKTQKGAANGVATLDSSGLVPTNQLPSYVDDVVEINIFASKAPLTCTTGDKYYNTTSKKIFTATATNTWSATGEDPVKGKIYVLLTATTEYDANSQFRWSGSEMVKLSDVGTGKADKVASATEGNFAGLDSEGNLTDSGKKAADFAASSHTHTKSEITDFAHTHTKSQISDFPTNVSDFTNNAGYLTSQDLTPYAKKATLAYATCTTGGSTGAKTVTLTGYEKASYGTLRIKFSNKNTYNPADNNNIAVTLNINGEGAAELYYDGAAVTPTHTWVDGETLEVYYDGTKYYANSIEGLNTRITALELAGVTTSMALVGNTATTRIIKADGESDTINIQGSTSSSRIPATMTCYSTHDSVAYPSTPMEVVSPKVNPYTGSNTGENFYVTHTFHNETGKQSVKSTILKFKITYMIDVTSKGQREIWVTYVHPIYYGAQDAEQTFDPTNLTMLTSGGSPYPTTTAARSYSIYLDTTPRKIYFRVPKDNVTGVSSVRLLSDGNYSNVAGGYDQTLEDDTHHVWVSTNAFQVTTAGNRTFIVNG